MDDINKDELGTRIKGVRSNLGQTAEAFGKNFDPVANRSLVSAWENGRYVPGPARVKKIAELADISVNELLHGNSYSIDFPEEYRFIKKNLIEVYSSFEEYEDVAKKPDSNDLDNEVQKYLIIYANKISTNPPLMKSIETKDNLLFQSYAKGHIEDEIFFSDEEMGYIRFSLYELYNLSRSLSSRRGIFYEKHEEFPSHSEYISDLLNETYSSILELLNDEEKEKMKERLSDGFRILLTDNKTD